MWPNPQETSDLVAFTEKTLNGKLHFLSSECIWENYIIFAQRYYNSTTFSVWVIYIYIYV